MNVTFPFYNESNFQGEVIFGELYKRSCEQVCLYPNYDMWIIFNFFAIISILIAKTIGFQRLFSFFGISVADVVKFEKYAEIFAFVLMLIINIFMFLVIRLL